MTIPQCGLIQLLTIAHNISYIGLYSFICLVQPFVCFASGTNLKPLLTVKKKTFCILEATGLVHLDVHGELATTFTHLNPWKFATSNQYPLPILDGRKKNG